MFPLKDDNPTTITPFVTWGLIAANIAVFFYQLTLPANAAEVFVYQFGAIPAVIFGDKSLPAGMVDDRI